jgi:RecB family exonuclease
MEEFSRSTATVKNRDFEGRNLVILEILVKYINRILAVDRKFLPLKILNIEETFTTRLKTSYLGQTMDILLGGTIDRIDQMGNTIRIIDYKTGTGDASYAGMEELFKKGAPERNSAVLQTFLYALLISDRFPDYPVQPGLYFIRDIYSESFDYQIICKETRRPGQIITDFRQQKDEFYEHLNDLVAELVNPAVPFLQVEDEAVCAVCPYRKICHR